MVLELPRYCSSKSIDLNSEAQSLIFWLRCGLQKARALSFFPDQKNHDDSPDHQQEAAKSIVLI